MLQFFIIVLRLICYIFNQKNSSMLGIGVNKIKFHFDTSQLCCGIVYYLIVFLQEADIDEIRKCRACQSGFVKG